MIQYKEGDLFTTAEVLQAVNGMPLIGAAQIDGIHFDSVAIDSRNVKEGTLFIAIKGATHDGHDYILDALSNGASAVFIRRDRMTYYNMFSETYPDRAFVTVNDGLEALEDLARAYVARFPKLVRIGVTGSSGKTTTRSLIASVLSQKYNVVQTRGNLNSITGLPLSMFSIRDKHEVGVFELGMNMVGEIAATAKVLRPNIGVVTNIGTAHIGLLGSRDNIAGEKKHIFDYFDEDSLAVLPDNDAYKSFLAHNVPGKKLYYGPECDKRIALVEDRGLEGTVFRVDGVDVHLRLPGTANYIDALAAVQLALYMGLSPNEIKAGVESVAPLGARSCVLRGRYTIVEDCYNANPESMRETIDFYANVDFSGGRNFIIADMLELGDMALAAHKAIVQLCLDLKVKVYYVGPLMAEACKELGVKERVYSTPSIESLRAIARDIFDEAANRDMVVLKGSHGMALERMIKLLEGKDATL